MRLQAPNGKRKQAEFRTSVTLCRTSFPTFYPVKTKLLTPPKTWEKDGVVGDCALIENKKEPAKTYFLIRVSVNLSTALCVETLIHEYAHALAWPYAGHGPSWAIWYGQLYDLFFSEDIEDGIVP